MVNVIYIRLQSNSDGKYKYGDQQKFNSIRISLGLYVNYTVSSYELSKGYTRPLFTGTISIPIPKDITDAHEKSIAKRKLTQIMR